MSGTRAYPVLEVRLDNIRHNARVMTEHCGSRGIGLAGVLKIADGDLEVARAFYDGGCTQLASSRLAHLQQVKRHLPAAATMLLRLPMPAEAGETVRWCDVSLNSQWETLDCLNRRAEEQAKRHSVVLMLETGDLREGVPSVGALCRLARKVEEEMGGLHLLGVGTSLSCFGSILPTKENLGELVRAAGEIEGAFGRKLEVVSGGSSTSLLLMQNEGIPEGINHLRIGTNIVNPKGIRLIRGIRVPGLREDTAILRAQLIEVETKPSVPYGKSSVNWSGSAVQFVDRGCRRRAIAALGSLDIGDHHRLIPMDDGVQVLGGSSDHTILDVEESGRDWRTGDIVSFELYYTPLLYAFSTRHVRIEYV